MLEPTALDQMLFGLQNRIFPPGSNAVTGHGIVTAENVTQLGLKAQPEVISEPSADEELPDETAQDGVRQAEAITLSWTKTSLGAAYIL